MLARSGKWRTFRDNQLLGIALCATSGFMNAGGLFVVDVVTSHVTGHWTNAGKELALQNWSVALKTFAWVLAFLVGAICSTFLVEMNRTERRRSIYVRPVIVESVLVTVFALWGSRVAEISPEWKAIVAGYLCFTLGLQNALLSRLTGGMVRGTHMTGITTDLGIEIVRLFLVTRERLRIVRVESGRPLLRGGLRDVAMELVAIARDDAFLKTRLLSSMLFSFAIGAVGGALSYMRWGSLGALPVAAALLILAGRELLELRREIDHERRQSEKRTTTTTRHSRRLVSQTAPSSPPPPETAPAATPSSPPPPPETPPGETAPVPEIFPVFQTPPVATTPPATTSVVPTTRRETPVRIWRKADSSDPEAHLSRLPLGTRTDDEDRSTGG
jgi:uncharacterized membrane protein YoaK (UPF0700 family)